jgi:hypothetical protein
MDPLAFWGAVTGTAGATVAIRREVLNHRKRIAVDHGWKYLFQKGQPSELLDMHIYVMVTNTGGRDMAVQHVGWEWMDQESLRTGIGKRAEVPLERPALVKPDGPPEKFEVRAAELLHLVDAFDTPIRPVAFTGGGNHAWRGNFGPLAQQVPELLGESGLRDRLTQIVAETDPPTAPGGGSTYGLTPLWLPEEEGSTAGGSG